jgi:hypothetical protein
MEFTKEERKKLRELLADAVEYVVEIEMDKETFLQEATEMYEAFAEPREEGKEGEE